MLPKCALGAPVRQGKKHKDQNAAKVRAKCERWLAGERLSLWSECETATTRTAQKDAPDKVRERQEVRAIDLAREGLYGKACSALVGTPPLQRTREVTATLRAKHPLAAAPPNLSHLGPAPRASVPDIAADAVEQKRAQFPARRCSRPFRFMPTAFERRTLLPTQR